jgi:hypothetical protein
MLLYTQNLLSMKKKGTSTQHTARKEYIHHIHEAGATRVENEPVENEPVESRSARWVGYSDLLKV